MKTNVKATRPAVYTHEGARARNINAEQSLRRSIMSCMLWENEFYEDGVSIANRVAELVHQVAPAKVAQMAIEAREGMKLRHMPLWIVRNMANSDAHKPFVADTLARVIQRADELSEFLAIYWKDGKTPIANSVKKGLAEAFKKFNAYQLTKYDREGAVKLRDVLFLCHAKPESKEQAEIWKQLVDGTLPIPGTWENRLSSGEDKKTVWEDLLQKNELGALALLRNLRNMERDGVDENLIFKALDVMSVERVLPFRFIAAAKYAPHLEAQLEQAMFKALAGKEKLPGKTVMLIDISGSMDSAISDKSELMRWEVSAGLAMLARELCDNVAIYLFNSDCKKIANRRGFALKDLIGQNVNGGTYTGNAVEMVNANEKYDRLIIFTDEQSHQTIPAPTAKGYVVNVASNKNGIGYGEWTHVDGFSENILDYIIENEK